MVDSTAPDTSGDFDPKRLLKEMSSQAGIYQMFDGADKILYVGKAKNLKNRLASYFRSSGLSSKTQALVAKIARVEVTLTGSESEALILEQNLIKAQRPPYNILLRDDKSYPYIFVSSEDDYPRLSLHRGNKKKKGRYFGPFPNVGAVRDSLNFLQKTFRVRQCEDSVFSNRSRPCLQYQIKRCSAPCVDKINREDYAEDLRHTELFLKGSSDHLMAELADAMEQASRQLDFEKAADYRDQISALRRIQSQQVVEGGSGDLDVLAVHRQAGSACVHVLFVRQGRILGSRSYFPGDKLSDSDAELLSAFIAQFYLAANREIPREVISAQALDDQDLLSRVLSDRLGASVKLSHKVRGARAQWQALAQTAAEQNLRAQIASKQSVYKRFEQLQDVLQLEDLPQRLECFDISHSSGELTVASCVVFDHNGPLKSDYRRFNIEGVTAGDDYAAMQQALMRRYTRVQKEEGKLPDLLIVDGGKGQLSQALKVLAELAITEVQLLGIAKGTTRKAGFETLFFANSEREIVLEGDSGALHLIQHIRDEAHRFAITGHKQRRDKKRKTSTLEDIAGVGPKRRRELLRHFGGLQQIQQASQQELERVSSISKKVAEDIYNALHND